MVTTSNRAIIDTDLQEVTNRHDTATAVVDVLNRALDTIPLLSAEINRLRRRLATTLGDFNNLLAAARATPTPTPTARKTRSTTCATNSAPKASSVLSSTTRSGHDEPPHP